MSKPKCLKYFAANRITRGWKPLKVADYLANVRWLPFLLQAGQSAYYLTGYGIVLGGVMATVSDTFWGVVRAAGGGAVRVEGPPPADPLGKALRYLSQPAYHLRHSQLMTFEEHYLLAAADAVAVNIVTANLSPALVLERGPILEAARVVDYEPWAPDTVAGLTSVGYVRGAPMGEPLPGMTGGSTYGEVWRAIAAGLPDWWQTVAGEFPRATQSTYFSYLVSETGREVFDWFNQQAGSIAPVFEPEELAIARLFEVGILPDGENQPDLLGEFAQRAKEIAAAAGREFPQALDIRLALGETFGGSRAL